MYIFNMEDILGRHLRFHEVSFVITSWSFKGSVQGTSKDGGLGSVLDCLSVNWPRLKPHLHAELAHFEKIFKCVISVHF